MENNVGILKFLGEFEKRQLGSPSFATSILHTILRQTQVYKLVKRAQELEKKAPHDHWAVHMRVEALFTMENLWQHSASSICFVDSALGGVEWSDCSTRPMQHPTISDSSSFNSKWQDSSCQSRKEMDSLMIYSMHCFQFFPFTLAAIPMNSVLSTPHIPPYWTRHKELGICLACMEYSVNFIRKFPLVSRSLWVQKKCRRGCVHFVLSIQHQIGNHIPIWTNF